jgi:hypothetical protein
MGVFIMGCLTALLLVSLVTLCVHCIKLEKSVLDITGMVERRVLELYDVKK